MALNSSRDLFFNMVAGQVEKDDVYIVAADLAGFPFDAIRRDFPNRYVAVGIAEQNMISIACGLALEGKKVIAYTSNPFISLRAFDQIRNGVGIMELPVTIAGVGTGFSIAEYGTTHFATEDYSIVSLCPSVRIVTVTDDHIAALAAEAIYSNKVPCYLRFDKLCSGELPAEEDADFTKGFRVLKQGQDTAVLTNGYMAHIACSAAFAVQPTIIDLFVHPFDRAALLQELKKYRRIVTYEEQQRRGGMGSEILELLNDAGVYLPVTRLGVDYGERFPAVYGSREYWHDKYQISQTDLIKVIG